MSNVDRQQVEIIIGQRVMVDAEIALEIVWLNARGVRTEACCSGHGLCAPTALIKPSSIGIAKALGYDPRYREGLGLFEIELKGLDDEIDST